LSKFIYDTQSSSTDTPPRPGAGQAAAPEPVSSMSDDDYDPPSPAAAAVDEAPPVPGASIVVNGVEFMGYSHPDYPERPKGPGWLKTAGRWNGAPLFRGDDNSPVYWIRRSERPPLSTDGWYWRGRCYRIYPYA